PFLEAHNAIFEARARDEAGNWTEIVKHEVYTVPNPVNGVTFSEITPVSFKVSWDSNGNIPDTKYQVLVKKDDVVVIDSGWIDKFSGTAFNLNQNTEYNVEIQAKN